MIYKMDNKTLDGNIPTIPQWTGPPHATVEVQAMLFASLAASLFSAFLAVLGKQWVNRYESIDVRGSAVGRHRSRQRKLDGISTWYFNPVMESLPLMLQGALFLLGCALSRYFWEINRKVALVVLCVTSFGLVLYLFVVIAGTVHASCPYQTPAAQILHYHLYRLVYIRLTLLQISRSLRRITASFRSTLSAAVKTSLVCRILTVSWDERKRCLHPLRFFTYLFHLFLLLPIGFLLDTYHLWISMIRKVCRQVRPQLLYGERLDQRCVLWILQTSSDEPVRLSALDYISALDYTSPQTDFTPDYGFPDHSYVDPALVTYCLDRFRYDFPTDKSRKKYDLCCLHMVSHLAVGWRFKILEDLSERYCARDAPIKPGCYRPTCTPTFHAICHVLRAVNPGVQKSTGLSWDDYRPTSNEHVIVAHALVRISWFGCEMTQRQKVPRHVLRFALHSLSLDPPPPTSVIADSLRIIAIDLNGGEVITRPRKRCVHVL